MNLKKKISSRHFVLSMISMLIICLAFLAGLYYILNIQYQRTETPFSVGPVTTKPRSLLLELDRPEDNSLIFTDSIEVAGKTSPAKEVLIYTDTNNLVVKSKPDGSFSVDLDLDNGTNNITVAVFDQTGQSKSLKRTVYYSKEKI